MFFLTACLNKRKRIRIMTSVLQERSLISYKTVVHTSHRAKPAGQQAAAQQNSQPFSRCVGQAVRRVQDKDTSE